jgi:hypothetical protein
MKQAGMDMIEIEEYYRRFNGYAFRVGLWESHADEQGHLCFNDTAKAGKTFRVATISENSLSSAGSTLQLNQGESHELFDKIVGE